MARRTRDYAADITRRIAEDLADTSSKAVGEVLRTYIKNHGPVKQVMRDKLLEVNNRSLQTAHKQMLDSYSRIPRTKNGAYRADIASSNSKYGPSRYAGGMLQRALANSKNSIATTNRAQFLDITHMNREAPQWYRLSFGAGVGFIFATNPMKNPFNGRKLPNSPTLDNFGPSRKWGLPDNYKWRWMIKSDGIHVTSNPEKGMRATGRKFSYEPEGWVQDGVNAFNEVYPTLLLNSVRDYLKPRDRKKIITLNSKLRLAPISFDPSKYKF